MNRKLARWTAGVVAAAALPVAALAPAASSASAATLPNTATVAAKTVVWLPFSGYGSPYPTLAADFQACENLAQPLGNLYKTDLFVCVPEYAPLRATASNRYDLWTVWLEEIT